MFSVTGLGEWGAGLGEYVSVTQTQGREDGRSKGRGSGNN